MSQDPTPFQDPFHGGPSDTGEFQGSISLRVSELIEPSAGGQGGLGPCPVRGQRLPRPRGHSTVLPWPSRSAQKLSGQPLQTPPDPSPLRHTSYLELSTGGRAASVY